jgi:hypothetical protein
MTILTLEQYHLAKFASWNHLRVSRYSSCRAFRFAWPFSIQRLALVFRRCSGTRNGVEGIPVNDHGSLRQKWFLKWPALEQTLLKEQEYPAMR